MQQKLGTKSDVVGISAVFQRQPLQNFCESFSHPSSKGIWKAWVCDFEDVDVILFSFFLKIPSTIIKEEALQTFPNFIIQKASIFRYHVCFSGGDMFMVSC